MKGAPPYQTRMYRLRRRGLPDAPILFENVGYAGYADKHDFATVRSRHLYGRASILKTDWLGLSLP